MAATYLRIPFENSQARETAKSAGARWQADAVADVWTEDAIARYEIELRDEIENQIATLEREAREQDDERWDGMA